MKIHIFKKFYVSIPSGLLKLRDNNYSLLKDFIGLKNIRESLRIFKPKLLNYEKLKNPNFNFYSSYHFV